jgi:hypothetical protein
MSVHPDGFNDALRGILGAHNPGMNGDTSVSSDHSLDNGVIGSVVFLAMAPWLAAEMRRVALRSVDHYREPDQHKKRLERRAVVVVYQGQTGATAAHLAAERALSHYHAERAGTLDLVEMGFDGQPQDFVTWWEDDARNGALRQRSGLSFRG